MIDLYSFVLIRCSYNTPPNKKITTFNIEVCISELVMNCKYAKSMEDKRLPTLGLAAYIKWQPKRRKIIFGETIKKVVFCL